MAKITVKTDAGRLVGEFEVSQVAGWEPRRLLDIVCEALRIERRGDNEGYPVGIKPGDTLRKTRGRPFVYRVKGVVPIGSHLPTYYRVEVDQVVKGVTKAAAPLLLNAAREPGAPTGFELVG